ncbi:unnamed protein product [Polarella glacialis]|uniref:Uncharacterized protein n=1 Tax=Polarella glacialis TaxID=89957 RepID=A0A813LN21_POLGL|nr:unnamed protein product [Polarella glacialis]
MAQKAILTPDDFEVYWFEPPHYVDPDTKDFLIKCIRETNRKLIDDNRKLESAIQKYTLLENGALATVVRTLKKDHSVPAILKAFFTQLQSKQEMQDFKDMTAKLLRNDPEADVANTRLAEQHEEAVPAVDPAMLEELEMLRAKSSEQEQTIGQLRSQLAAGIDVKLERERADEERQRADLVQQRVERLERQQRALQQEIHPVAEREKATRRVTLSVSKLSDALQCLTPAGSTTCTPSASPCAQRPTPKHTSPKHMATLSPHRLLEDEDEGEDEGGFDQALSHLDAVATGFELMAHDVLTELHDLRSRLAMQEALKSELSALTLPSKLGAEEEQRGEAAQKLELVQQMQQADGRAKALEASLAEERAQRALEQALLEEERATSSSLREKLAQSRSEVEGLQMKLELARARLKTARDKLKSLRILHGIADTGSDGEDDLELEDGPDYMVPYRKRARCVGKSRWELLSEDANCVRRRREHMAGSGSGQPALAGQLPGVRHNEVFAAFGFLSVQLAPDAPKEQQQHLQRFQQQLQPQRAANGRVHPAAISVNSALPGGSPPGVLPTHQAAVPAPKQQPTQQQQKQQQQEQQHRQQQQQIKLLQQLSQFHQPQQRQPPEEDAHFAPRAASSSHVDTGDDMERQFNSSYRRRRVLVEEEDSSPDNMNSSFRASASSAADVEWQASCSSTSLGLGRRSISNPEVQGSASTSGLGFRPAMSLRQAAQTSVSSPLLTKPNLNPSSQSVLFPAPPALMPTLARAKSTTLRKDLGSTWGGGAEHLGFSKGAGAVEWLGLRRPGGVPLTNAGRSLRPSQSASFLPEVSHSFPAGRVLKPHSPPSWLMPFE